MWLYECSREERHNMLVHRLYLDVYTTAYTIPDTLNRRSLGSLYGTTNKWWNIAWANCVISEPLSSLVSGCFTTLWATWVACNRHWARPKFPPPNCHPSPQLSQDRSKPNEICPLIELPSHEWYLPNDMIEIQNFNYSPVLVLWKLLTNIVSLSVRQPPFGRSCRRHAHPFCAKRYCYLESMTFYITLTIDKWKFPLNHSGNRTTARPYPGRIFSSRCCLTRLSPELSGGFPCHANGPFYRAAAATLRIPADPFKEPNAKVLIYRTFRFKWECRTLYKVFSPICT